MDIVDVAELVFLRIDKFTAENKVQALGHGGLG